MQCNNCDCITIEANQVFDSCMSRHDVLTVNATLTSFSIPNPVYPLNISRIVSNDNRAYLTEINTTRSTISNTRYYRINLSCMVNVPITAYFVDANNVSGIAQGLVSEHKNVNLALPRDAYLTHNFSAHVILANHAQEITNSPNFDFSCCAIIILKVTALVDIIIPKCGYKTHRRCTGSLCERIFSNFPYG